MSTNKLPKRSDHVLTLAVDMTEGLKTLEASVGLKHSTELDLRAALEETIRTKNAYNARLADDAVLSNAQAVANSDSKHFIANAKAVLRNVFGKEWSPAWSLAGFSAPSLRTPRNLADRQLLLNAIADYLRSNPEKQNPPLNVTIERASELSELLKEARAATIKNASAIASAKASRDKAEKDLRRRMTNLIKELGQLVPDNDPVWYAFGLNRPSDPAIPPVPDQLAVTAGAPGSIHVAWATAARATRYRVYTKQDDEPEFQVTSTLDPATTLTGLKEGATLLVQVSAANEGGESKPSVPARILVPGTQPAMTSGSVGAN